MKQEQQTAGNLGNNEAQSRYELRVDEGVAAFAQYRIEGNNVRFVHTEVDPAYEGQGLGSKLAAYALDDVKRRGMKALPQCKFMAGYIARHEKDYGDLLAR